MNYLQMLDCIIVSEFPGHVNSHQPLFKLRKEKDLVVLTLKFLKFLAAAIFLFNGTPVRDLTGNWK